MDITRNMGKAARALWNLKPHTLLKKSKKYPSVWEAQPRVIKKEYYRQVRTVLKVYGISEVEPQ